MWRGSWSVERNFFFEANFDLSANQLIDKPPSTRILRRIFQALDFAWLRISYGGGDPLKDSNAPKIFFRPLSLFSEAEVAMNPCSRSAFKVISSECSRPTRFKGYQGPGPLRTQIKANTHELWCSLIQDHTASREGLFLSRDEFKAVH